MVSPCCSITGSLKCLNRNVNASINMGLEKGAFEQYVVCTYTVENWGYGGRKGGHEFW